MTITTSDVPTIAASIRVAGELFEVHGEAMLTLTDDWEQGARTANLEPSRGNPWDVDNECFVPNDPTGEAILVARADKAAELRMRLARLNEDAQWVRDLAHVLVPLARPETSSVTAWCSHHLKVGLCEPRKNDAERNTLCRWCSDIWAIWKELPPLSIVKDRHNGKRISEDRLKAAFKREGLILEEVGDVTKAVRAARPQERKRNQNEKKKAS